MDVLLIGRGGREAALAFRIDRSPSLGTLHVVGPNPSWPDGAQVHPEPAAGAAALAEQLGVDLVVVGPEAPLADGLADRLADLGIPCFGPSRLAAMLESSKVFTKQVLAEAGVDTAGFLVATRGDEASLKAARRRCERGQVVIKADGLAAGKGVVVCSTPEEAHAALDEVLERFGGAADTVLLEDVLVGPEVSVFALSDGERVVPLVAAQDHKRLRDGDEGPNTGGMGAFCPSPLVDQAVLERWVAEIHAPVVEVMARRGTPYKGVLYAGLMVTTRGPQVLEFNVRFGDPECQVIMSLWDEDVLPWLLGAAMGALPQGQPKINDGAACCVVLASEGYPYTSVKGVAVSPPVNTPGVEVFAAGVTQGADGVLRTSGGRVLGVTAVGATLAAARDLAYGALDGWRFAGAQWRTDIGAGL